MVVTERTAGMAGENPYKTRVSISGLALLFFAVPHLIDDFLFDIPAEFGLTNVQAQILSGIFIVGFAGILIKASQGASAGYLGCASMGGFLALAGILKHLPGMLAPGPYWSGFFSELLIVGLVFSGIGLMGVSILAWRAT